MGASQPHKDHKASFAGMCVGALGIVFGDIGTSPLYTLRECLRDGNVEPGEVLGVLSLIFWSLTLVVTVKYLIFVMRADNQGEGGIFALLAIIPMRYRKHTPTRWSGVTLLVIAGAALLYGDGTITPAISVLSAIEGIEVVAPHFGHLVVPITCAILIGLFAVQHRGTAAVGRLFGPVMVTWFGTIAVLGVMHIAKKPYVLNALLPTHAVHYFHAHGLKGVLVLGSVVLAVTGGEALYADMGHFGRQPIRLAWTFLVMPSLVLCYFGQGALLLHDPTHIDNPFFALVDKGPLTYALVVLSGLATIIASQALISGAFSLTRQAMQLGFFPRVTVTHTAANAEGQIYIPQINYLLAAGCLLLVIGFQKSERLASAYGIAVTGTMMLTSIVFFVVMRRTWNWSIAKALPVLVLFLSFDVPFFIANTVKLVDGGWVPVLIGVACMAAMLIWSKGRTIISETYGAQLPTYDHIFEIEAKTVARVPGMGVFMAGSLTHVPPVMVHYVERCRTLHESVVLLTVVTESAPTGHHLNDRIETSDLGHGFYRVIVHYGFMEEPNVPKALGEAAARLKLTIDDDNLTYFLGRESVLATNAGLMSEIPERIYGVMSRNEVTADQYFKIPAKNAVEIGLQLDL